MGKLKYQGYSVVFQEVPGEISLAFNISGCPYRCKGCHSPHLWDDIGRNLSEDFEVALNEYQNKITCVCFMGGDQGLNEIGRYCDIAHDRGLKTCIYTGAESIPKDYVRCFDYIKVGPYIEERGGLNKETTNQRMFRMIDGVAVEDITYRFKYRID